MLKAMGVEQPQSFFAHGWWLVPKDEDPAGGTTGTAHAALGLEETILGIDETDRADRTLGKVFVDGNENAAQADIDDLAFS